MPRSKLFIGSFIALWILVIGLVIINAIALIGLFRFRSVARQQLPEAIENIEALNLEDMVVPVIVDETIPVQMEIPFEDNFVVPIQETLPVQLEVLFEETITVPVNSVIPINTTVNVPVRIPGLGTLTTVPVPIEMSVPINLVVEAPVKKTIPIDTEVPIDLTIEVPVKTIVPIDTEVPVQLDFPVTVPLDQLGLQDQVTQLTNVLRELLTFVGGN